MIDLVQGVIFVYGDPVEVFLPMALSFPPITVSAPTSAIDEQIVPETWLLPDEASRLEESTPAGANECKQHEARLQAFLNSSSCCRSTSLGNTIQWKRDVMKAEVLERCTEELRNQVEQLQQQVENLTAALAQKEAANIDLGALRPPLLDGEQENEDSAAYDEDFVVAENTLPEESFDVIREQVRQLFAGGILTSGAAEREQAFRSLASPPECAFKPFTQEQLPLPKKRKLMVSNAVPGELGSKVVRRSNRIALLKKATDSRQCVPSAISAKVEEKTLRASSRITSFTPVPDIQSEHKMLFDECRQGNARAGVAKVLKQEGKWCTCKCGAPRKVQSLRMSWLLRCWECGIQMQQAKWEAMPESGPYELDELGRLSASIDEY